MLVLDAMEEFLGPDVGKQVDLARQTQESVMSAAGMDNEEGWQSSLEKALPEYHMSIHRQPSAFRTRPYSFLVNCDPFRREDWKKKRQS